MIDRKLLEPQPSSKVSDEGPLTSEATYANLESGPQGRRLLNVRNIRKEVREALNNREMLIQDFNVRADVFSQATVFVDLNKR